jgi:hypothetical protein
MQNKFPAKRRVKMMKPRKRTQDITVAVFAGVSCGPVRPSTITSMAIAAKRS